MQHRDKKNSTSIAFKTMNDSLPPPIISFKIRLLRMCPIFMALVCFLFFWSFLASLGLSLGNLNDLLINQQIRHIEFNSRRSGHRRVETEGQREMHDSSVTFIGIGKNVGEKLPAVLAQVIIVLGKNSLSQVNTERIQSTKLKTRSSC